MTVCGLRALRGAMEGIAASLLCTCGAEGQPNVSMIGQVNRVDDAHVALSWQVFNETRANLMATGRACVELFDPLTHARHRLHPDHVETRTEGPLHEMMKARLAGIASPRGLEGVFRLLGADLFRVTGIGQLPPPPAALRERTGPPLLSAVRTCADELARGRDFDELDDAVLVGVVRHLAIPHAILLMAEGVGRLFAIGSRGHAAPGVGAATLPGEGVTGVAAREEVPIRIGHLGADDRHDAAPGAAARQAGLIAGEPHGVPLPGLGDPHSQIAVPVLSAGRVPGVLFCDSPEIMRFDHEEEEVVDARMLLAGHLGALATVMAEDDAHRPADPPPAPAAPAGLVTVRHHPRDAGGCSPAVDGDPDRPRDVHLPGSRDDGQPPAPFRPTPRGWAGPPDLPAMPRFETFGQHRPLNRQVERSEKEGAAIGRPPWPTGSGPVPRRCSRSAIRSAPMFRAPGDGMPTTRPCQRWQRAARRPPGSGPVSATTAPAPAARRRPAVPRRHRQDDRHRPSGLACRCRGTMARHADAAPARPSCPEPEGAAHGAGGPGMQANRVRSAKTPARVAAELGEAIRRLHDLAIGTDPEAGVVRVCGTAEIESRAFVPVGIENLVGMIARERSRQPRAATLVTGGIRTTLRNV
jgi:hypothetical protein